MHRDYINRSVYGHFRDYYEHNDETNVIFKFDYKFISEKCFFYMRTLGIKSILHAGTVNPLNRVRLML